MRKLSELTGIDVATISRIVNGKQPPKLSHLKQFAVHLQIPLEKLVNETVSVETDLDEDSPTDIFHSVDSLQDVLGLSYLFDQQFTTESVQKELVKYEQYAQTAEGNQKIHDDFRSKVEQVNGAGPFIEQLKEMYEIYSNENTSTEKRAVLGSALLYFILSTDIIPDYVFPIGYLDDAIAVQLVLRRLSQINDSK
jgi:uncharacterized membrane protein YkvA (DUF1232 family)